MLIDVLLAYGAKQMQLAGASCTRHARATLANPNDAHRLSHLLDLKAFHMQYIGGHRRYGALAMPCQAMPATSSCQPHP